MTGRSDDRPRCKRDLAAELRLHPERPAVMRLSRKVIIGLAAIAALAVSAALIWVLTQEPRKPASSGELYNTESKPPPDALAAFQRDYATIPKPKPRSTPRGVPPLGPPLPGDLGRPMLSAGVAPPGPFPWSRCGPTEACTRAKSCAQMQAVCQCQHPAADRFGRTEYDLSEQRSLRVEQPSRDRTARRRVGPEYAESQVDLREHRGRSKDGKPRSPRRSGVPLHFSSPCRDPGRPHHGDTVRSARPSHSPSDRARR